MSSDDAGNGLRGLRASASTELFEVIRNHYGFDRIDEVNDLGGSSNLNLLLSVAGNRYVARVYRPYVTASRLGAIQLVRRGLKSGGIPCAETVPTNAGDAWTVVDGRLVELERFIETDGPMDTLDQIETGLPWLGRMHSLLQGITVDPDGNRPLFANHIEPFNTVAWTVRATDRVRKWGPTQKELQLTEAAEELARQVADAERDLVPLVVRQLVHGDFWDNNVFYRNGRVVLVTDFDFMGNRARIDDLALTLYFTSLKFRFDPGSETDLERLRQLVGAYERSLDDELTTIERTALPFAVARQPLWWIGQWLALLDDETEARLRLAQMGRELDWALRVISEADRWQKAFT